MRGQQGALVARAVLLMERSQPVISLFLGHHGSRHGVMRELRAPSSSRPFQVFPASTPRPRSILPIGGDKTGNDRFNEEHVTVADALYDEHIDGLREEGLID